MNPSLFLLKYIPNESVFAKYIYFGGFERESLSICKENLNVKLKEEENEEVIVEAYSVIELTLSNIIAFPLPLIRGRCVAMEGLGVVVGERLQGLGTQRYELHSQ